jgi:hypothetical protein
MNVEITKNEAFDNQIVNTIFGRTDFQKSGRLERLKKAIAKSVFSIYSPYEVLELYCTRKNIECDLYDEGLRRKLNHILRYYAYEFQNFYKISGDEVLLKLTTPPQ